MRTVCKLGFIVLVGSLFMVGLVGAVSEWYIGDEVKLIVTTTNMGDVDVVESNGMIMVRTEAGTRYDAGFFNVEGVVKPGETIEVPLNWDSTDAPPGYYDIILDGVLTFANGEYEDTYSEVEDAFLLIDPRNGFREVPDVFTDGYISGFTQISDTYYEGNQFMIIVWVNNTGTTLFIPEIVLDFHGEGYDSGPLTEIYVDDPCEPGVEPYMRMCQLPEDMEAGDYQCDVELNMHFLDVELTGPEEVEAAYQATYTCSTTDPDADTLLYRWVILGVTYDDSQEWDDELDVNAYVQDTEKGWYDFGQVMDDEGVWPNPDYGDAYCFRWFLDGEQIVPDPNDAAFCEEVVDPIYNEYQLDFLFNKIDVDVPEVTLYSLTPEEPVLGIEPGEWWWTWEPAPIDEGLHTIEVEVIEPEFEYDVPKAWVQGSEYEPGETFPLYIYIENTGAYTFQAEFQIDVGEDLDFEPFIVEQPDFLIVPWNKIYEIEVTVSDDAARDEGYRCSLETVPVLVYDPDISEENLVSMAFTVVDHGLTDYWLFYTESGFDDGGNHSKVQDLMVASVDLDGTAQETEIIDEFVEGLSDEPQDATTIHVRELGEPEEPETPEEPSGETPAGTQESTETPTEPETPPEEEEPQSGPLGIIQSLIESILNFFRNLFG